MKRADMYTWKCLSEKSIKYDEGEPLFTFYQLIDLTPATNDRAIDSKQSLREQPKGHLFKRGNNNKNKQTKTYSVD